MARRRALGAGFDAAGSLVDLYIKDKMYRARMSSQQAAATTQARLQAVLGMLNSGNFQKLKPQEQEAFNDYTGSDLPVSTNDDILNQSVAGLSGADTRSKLPTKEELVAGVRAKGGMLQTGEQAVNAFNALGSRSEQLKNAETPTKVSSMITGANGEAVQGDRFMRPADLTEAGAFQTERTGAQEGLRKGQEFVAQTKQPGFLDATSDVAESTAAGQNASDYLDPDVMAAKTKLAEATATATAGARPISQAEHQAGEYANRMEQAEEVFGDSTFVYQIANMPWAKFVAFSALPASGQPEIVQKYWQAAENLINAKLRDESGAVINASEFVHANKQYLPEPGNTAEILNMKRENRRVGRESNIRAAGRAYQPYVRQSATPQGSATYQSLFGQPQQ